MTPDENAEAFARIVAKSGKVYGHPDLIKDLPRASSPNRQTVWDANGVEFISSPLLDPKKIYAVDLPKERSPFPWPDVPKWDDEPTYRMRCSYGIVKPRLAGILYLGIDAGGSRPPLAMRIRERKRIAKKRRKAAIKAENARRRKS